MNLTPLIRKGQRKADRAIAAAKETEIEMEEMEKLQKKTADPRLTPLLDELILKYNRQSEKATQCLEYVQALMEVKPAVTPKKTAK